ncbi:MAG TPA: SAM-dependent methyltransferase [Pyrinomonadaceae bacterium]|jgi:SAM-dependent MidA family methyltransferase|nr:SAM-dependent methyltransferase [Pyrinomonadaceae bacterium]
MIEILANPSTLANRLEERIKRDGPITFYDWMKAALYDPVDGYYCRTDRKRWGREGDYRTSPERSSLFAATFARYFAGLYDQLGQPAAWTILEVGAGEGHFALGLLRGLQQFSASAFAALTYVIDEVSEASIARAREKLLLFQDRIQFKSLDEVDLNAGVIFSNELFDAFPVHRIVLDNDEFKEYYVTLGQSGKFEWLPESPSRVFSERLQEYFAEIGSKPVAGQAVEVNLEIEDWLRRATAKLHSGYIVTVDYGALVEDLYSPLAEREGTLRSFERHQFVADLLAQPGEHDLTATVNWSFVKSVGARLGLEFVELSRQDRFLLANGLLEELELESANANDDAARLQLSTAAREMILPTGMAASFQVLVQRKK